MTDPKLRDLGHQPLRHAVAEAVTEAIISGQLKPGTAIVQSQLAAALGVSRAPLREALNKLAEEGLVINVPYKGTIVAPLDRRDVEELRSLRLVIERFAALLLVDRITEDEIGILQAFLDEMQLAANRGDEEQLFIADLKLHSKICELSGHGLLFEVWEMYEKRFRRVLSLRNKANEDLQALFDMHAPLLEAFRSRNHAMIEAFYESHGADLTEVLVNTWPEDFEESESLEPAVHSKASARN